MTAILWVVVDKSIAMRHDHVTKINDTSTLRRRTASVWANENIVVNTTQHLNGYGSSTKVSLLPCTLKQTEGGKPKRPISRGKKWLNDYASTCKKKGACQAAPTILSKNNPQKKQLIDHVICSLI